MIRTRTAGQGAAMIPDRLCCCLVPVAAGGGRYHRVRR
jgi:hypothetical protein